MHRTALALAVLPLAACQCDALSDRPPTGACTDYWPEASVSIAAVETPPQAIAPSGTLLVRDLLVMRQDLSSTSQGRLESVLSYQAMWFVGELHLDLAAPWRAMDYSGSTLRWTHFRQASACSDGTLATLGEDLLRDGQGTLLLLSASAPLTGGRIVPLVTELAPEVSLEWQDLGCGTHSSISGTARTVGLVVWADGESWTAGLGQRTSFTVGGATYWIAVALAERETTGDCGALLATIYRDGFLYRPHDASAPSDGGTP